MTWDDLGRAARALATTIDVAGYRPDVILAVARGGLLVGGALAYALGVKATYLINVEFYTGVDERLIEPVLLPPVPELVDLGDARVLVADDVADTGLTLGLVRDFCRRRVREVRTAVLYEKPHSVFACEYVWRRTDRWIDFPWSAMSPVTAAPARTRTIAAG